MRITIQQSRDDHGARLAFGRVGSLPLGELLAAAGDAVNADHAYARAWSLLLRVDWTDRETAEAFRYYVQRHARGSGWNELQPLFALIAAVNPGLVCDLFPIAADAMVLSLCGDEGMRVALHELQGRDRRRREESAFALQAFVEAGAAVPLAPIVEAHRREWDADVRETLRALQAAIEERQPAAETAGASA